LPLAHAGELQSDGVLAIKTAAGESSKKKKSNSKTSTTVPQSQSTPSPADTAEKYQNLEMFQKVLSFVEGNYVESTSSKDLIQGAIKGMLSTLDPHSNFLNQEVYRDMKVDTQGKFGGIGIEVGVRDGVLTVISPMEDTPAWKAGLKPGDRLLKIDGSSTKGLTITDAVTKMRGKLGQKVRLQFIRKGFDRPREVVVERAMIKVNPVRAEALEPGYGYVRLKTFNEAAAKEVKAGIALCEKSGKLKGLILDLRANPGGLLDQAVDVASLFYDEGVVVSTIGRNKEQMEVRHAKKGMARKDFNLAVLVDGSTASAAEIVAGAVQDQGRGVILGQQTFGKGSVQTVIDLGQEMCL
jgi:carboxyl-terminal processing protease